MFEISRKRMVVISSALAVVLVLVLATAALAEGPIVHQVNAGGPDACEFLGFPHPGCDGDFSLVAQQFADGSVSGQYTDRFAQGNGIHAVIDCLVVVGNQAWVSGVITQGDLNGVSLVGLSLITRVQDNGASANDPDDQISFSFIGNNIPCTDQPDLPLLDAPDGQVQVD
ncbi:MAG: hypothetical protein L0332_04885 [Chloroflexi bacterium]|nr:hypothetical protein [Chloroflexota bacterium]MCI0580376.1 hypothetical protein [Chloroflexota bacterium]MCI0649512.1 hypothetical protein [Chloroflexota bacterium]MCI0726043.1 hypothetical protein [Chloroflexota bacterium]